MNIERFLLAYIARRTPAIYDALKPHGPLTPFDRRAEVQLNPQPLPPAELGAAAAAEFIHAAWQADRLGLDRQSILAELDDLCPRLPRHPRFPPWWPPVPGPDPHPEWLAEYHVGFAARIAVAADRYDGTSLGESFDRAIDHSMSSITTMLLQ